MPFPYREEYGCSEIGTGNLWYQEKSGIYSDDSRKVLLVRVFRFLPVLLVFVSLVGCRAKHDTDAFYLDRAQAEKSGEFVRGWLPDSLPKSTKAIHLAYDLSPSREWCAFDFDPADANSFLQSLTPVYHPSAATTRVSGAQETWWPKTLEGDLDVERIQSAGMGVYALVRSLSQEQSETTLFFIDKANGHGYFYGH